MIAFSEQVLGVVLMPWQRWLLVHALELDEDRGYRFRTVIVLVSRQNGKTTVLKVLALWRLLLDDARLVLGTSTNLDYARESWEGAVELAKRTQDTVAEFRWPERRTNGEQTLTTTTGARYKIAAATRRGGRSLSVDLGICDELREHQSWDAWAAISGTTTATPNPQLWALSNAGDDMSVVLNTQREAALAAIESGRDDTMGLFEWSAPAGCALDDRDAWRAANPALGHTITEETLTSKLGSNPPAVFRTEHLCQRVPTLNAAVSATAWESSADAHGVMDHLRDRVAVGVDVAPDGAHVTLSAAAVEGDGRVRVEVVAAWESTDTARGELPAALDAVAPAAVAWFPSGPAAELAPVLRLAGLKAVEGAAGWKQTPDGRYWIELTGQRVNEACMGFAGMVTGLRVVHPDDPLLTAHVTGASRLEQGDGWRFGRRGGGHVDAAYSAAGAVYAALTMPQQQQLPKPMVV